MTTEAPEADFFGTPEPIEEIIEENLFCLNAVQRKVTTHLCNGKENLLFEFAIDPDTGKLRGLVEDVTKRHECVSEGYGIISLTFVFTYKNKKLFSQITKRTRLGAGYEKANGVIDGTVDTYNQKYKIQ